MLEIGSIDDTWNRLVQILTDFRENNISKRTRDVNRVLPWFSNKIKKLIKKRNNAFKRHRKTGLYYFKIKYNVARNVVTKEIRRAKSKYEAKVIKRSKNNRKVFYSYLATKNRKTVGKKVGPIVKVGIDGKEKVIVTKDLEVASLFNEYFSSVY